MKPTIVYILLALLAYQLAGSMVTNYLQIEAVRKEVKSKLKIQKITNLIPMTFDALMYKLFTHTKGPIQGITDLRIYGFTDLVFLRNQKQPERRNERTGAVFCDTDFMDSVYGFYGFSVRILWIYTDMDLIRALARAAEETSVP